MASSGGIAKVLVVGNVATGKTSVINRFVRNKFSKDYQTTIGVDFALKRVRVNNTDINVQLWDIAGQERFSGLSRIFYTHAVAAIIVYDLFQRDSFEAVIKWKKDIDAKVFLPSGAKIPVLLLGNKCDLADPPERQQPAVSDMDIEFIAKEHQFYAHFKCSALSGYNIKEACTHLVHKIAQNNLTEMRPPEQPESSQQSSSSRPVDLGQKSTPQQQQKSESGGCCS